MPSISTSFSQLLDPRFQKLFNEQYKQLPNRLGEFYDMMGDEFPTKADARFGMVGTFGDVPQFTGSVTYDDIFQGYQATLTHVEYAAGYAIEKKLYDDDMFGIMDAKPKGLATAAARTRQKHGAQLFVNSFSVDNTWLTHTEAVALCSDSHTTNASGVSTSAGFDNKVTTALSAVGVSAARIQMRKYRGDRGERISVMPNTLIVPIDLEEAAFEVVQSAGKPDTANNNANWNKDAFSVKSWEYLTDTNDWWMVDNTMQKASVKWVDRVGLEFGQVEDFDTFVGKWRLYMRYSLGWIDWRWVLGASVS